VAQARWLQSFDGTRLRLLSAGEGRPLLFVPGFTMTAEIWQGQLDALSPRFRVIAMDPRGQGRSGHAAGALGTENRAKDIGAVLSQLDLNDAVLIGWSLGAVDVLGYLRHFGAARIRGLVLVDNSVDPNFSSGPTGLRLLASLRGPDYEGVIRDFVPSIFKRPPGPERLAELTALSLLTVRDSAQESLKEAALGEGLAAALKRTGLKALYAVTPRFAEEGRKLKAELGSRLRLEIFEESGHALFADEAESFNRCIEEFASQ
jgi:non-heme chloroperoxidase